MRAIFGVFRARSSYMAIVDACASSEIGVCVCVWTRAGVLLRLLLAV